MKRLTSSALATTAVWLLLGCGQARADLVGFSYRWIMTPDPVIPAGTGSVRFALGADGKNLTAQTGDTSFIDAAIVTTTSLAGSDSPDSYNESFNLALEVTDKASGQKGTVNFAGTIKGDLSGTGSSLVAAFDDATPPPLPLGGYQYAVVINPPSADLPVPGSAAQTLIDAELTITAGTPPVTGGPGPKPAETPEPSSLVLGVSAASLAWLARRRRRTAGGA